MKIGMILFTGVLLLTHPLFPPPLFIREGDLWGRIKYYL